MLALLQMKFLYSLKSSNQFCILQREKIEGENP